MRRSGTLYVPNKRMKLLWECDLRVQISDGAWSNDLRHWEAYGRCDVEVDASRTTPLFDAEHATHEQIQNFEEYLGDLFSVIEGAPPRIEDELGENYTLEDFREDLRTFDRMSFKNLLDPDNCSDCADHDMYTL